MIIKFEMTNGVNTFRDAIILPEGLKMTDAEIKAMQQSRFDAWLKFINTPAEEE
jgi:hypothetical protein